MLELLLRQTSSGEWSLDKEGSENAVELGKIKNQFRLTKTLSSLNQCLLGDWISKRTQANVMAISVLNVVFSKRRFIR